MVPAKPQRYTHRRCIMPGMNGTGPEGQGPKTGRGAGRCAAGARRNNMTETGGTGQDNRCGHGMKGRGQKRGRNCGCGSRNRSGNR
ncbi:DUF5320 domain-containing protein [Desulfolithobacter dissulfuricans]|uniref:DUF5320 domain-containing protein n=1 Tax=Desulfolithobacter dissulfuricans TaxID=2795293 RepID=UPI00338F5E86